MNIGRPLEFDPEQALAAAMEVFWSYGYEATSLQDLLKAMDLSKSSFYQTFGSKQQLFMRCLSRYGNTMAANMEECLNKTPSGRQFIKEMLDATVKEADGGKIPRGCLILNTANEFSQQDSLIAEGVAQNVGRFIEVFQAAILRAQKEGDIAADKDAAILAGYLVSSKSGLQTMAKSGAGKHALKEIIQIIMRSLD